MSKLRATATAIRYSLFPPSGNLGKECPPNCLLEPEDLPAYSAIASRLLSHHRLVEITLPDMYLIAGFFIAIRLKRSGFTFRLALRDRRLVIIAYR